MAVVNILTTILRPVKHLISPQIFAQFAQARNLLPGLDESAKDAKGLPGWAGTLHVLIAKCLKKRHEDNGWIVQERTEEMLIPPLAQSEGPG